MNNTDYLSGKNLIGDDYDTDAIKLWFKDEAEGYADLGSKVTSEYSYNYHQLNITLGFSKLKVEAFNRVLGLGAAYGHEFLPIEDKMQELVILEPSESLSSSPVVQKVPVKYVSPVPSGGMNFGDGYFDLVTSLGVLHHIPNVSYVLSECYRVLSNGGQLLLREPIVSMGDWSKSRPGLTKRERGIPLELLREICHNIGFKISHENLCFFSPLTAARRKIKISGFNDKHYVFLDLLLSRIFQWNVSYHRTSLFNKLSPANVFMVLEKI
jgi:SAM-dependent methyltransferase